MEQDKLQMQKFDEEIFGILEDIKNFSLLVNEKLNSFDINTESKYISDIYKKRIEKINYLLSKKEEISWKSFIFENKTKFFEKVDDIQNIESDNIKNLEKITGYYGEQIKNISKQKSLLIYMK